MREIYDFRIPEKLASRYLRTDEGTVLGSTVRKVVVDADDPLFARIRAIHRTCRAKGESFALSWGCRRRYTTREMDSAELFWLRISAVFEPTGEDCGTVYRDGPCAEWGTDREQLSDLVLDLRKIPKRKDIAESLASEMVVSQRLAELIADAGLTGLELRPVRHSARYQDDSIDLKTLPSGRKLLRQAAARGYSPDEWAFTIWLNRPEQRPLLDQATAENVARKQVRGLMRGKRLPVWYQLVVTSPPVTMVPPTQFGTHVFDDVPQPGYQSDECNLAGLNVMTEVSVARSEWDGSDFSHTRQYVGSRGGVVMPSRLLLVTQRVRQMFADQGVSGAIFERAHLVPGGVSRALQSRIAHITAADVPVRSGTIF
jgi:hypothetical protein